MARIVLVTDHTPTRELVRRALTGSTPESLAVLGRDGISASGSEAALDHATEVLAIGPDVGAERAIRTVETAEELCPDVTVVLVADEDPETLQLAVAIGARDVVSPAADAGETAAALAAAAERTRRRRGQFAGDGDARHHRVIVVISPKGGAGKTTLSVNLAVALGRSHPGQVALFDGDLQFGDTRYALGLTPEVTVADAVRQQGRLDATRVKAFLTPHDSGIFVLASPDSPVEADGIRHDQIGQVLDGLAAGFPFVVVDTAAGIDEAALEALDHATDILLVVGNDVASVRAGQKTVKILSDLGLATTRTHLVLNRVDRQVGVPVKDIEAVLGMDVDVTVPEHRSVAQAGNAGTPAVLSDRRSPVAKAVTELAARFAPAAATGRRRHLPFARSN